MKRTVSPSARAKMASALAEGCLVRSPAELLFIPREAKRYPKPRLTLDQVRSVFSVLALRERTHATLLDDLGVDPQVQADQMGHTVDVNQNQYTRSSLERCRTAVNLLQKPLGVV